MDVLPAFVPFIFRLSFIIANPSSQLIKELHWITQESEDQQSRGTQLLEIYALEIQMYNETKNQKKLKVKLAKYER